MRRAAKEYFVTFSEPLEGIVSHMYQDILGLVTVGMGNLIDPKSLGAGLPWKKKIGGAPATALEYSNEWDLIKASKTLAKDGYLAAAPLTTLYLTRHDIDALVASKLDSNEVILRTRIPAYDFWCADAHLFIHSMAWALGPNMAYPKMFALLNAGNFYDASSECDFSQKAGTLQVRNSANKHLLMNAHGVGVRGLDPERLWYPNTCLGNQILTGSYNHSVTSLQEALVLLGYLGVSVPLYDTYGKSGEVDGVFGIATNRALMAFQKAQGLVMDGVAGTKTWAAIRNALK